MDDRIELETGSTPVASVIFLHGLGVNGHDLVPLVKQLPLASDLHVRFVMPHAPLRSVKVDHGRINHAWYDTPSFSFDAIPNIEHFRECESLVTDFIRQETLRGISPARIVLAGFSQGGVVALHAGLRQPQALGGIAVLSGYLALPQQLAKESADGSRNIPILMAHGRQDKLISHAMAKNSHTQLQAMGYSAEWCDYPMQHGVCKDEIADMGKWLNRIFANEELHIP